MIMAGQGTAAMELLDETGPLDALITPVGGGGLLSGCATIAKAHQPSIRVFGAEPEGANDTFLSMMAGERHRGASRHYRRRPARAQAGRVDVSGDQQLVERILLVSEDEIRAAVKFVLLRLKILVEPSGAVPVAAVLFRKLPPEIRSVGVVISGGNVDFADLAKM